MRTDFLLARVAQLEGLAARLAPERREVKAAIGLCRDTRRRIRHAHLPPLSARRTAYAVRHHTTVLRTILREESTTDE